ncbi:ceroid-lipofuscinosis neuronal protein 6 homolog [Gouania willdenowi]|uniref:ceroid-lipofuscinosis neuronal protein 6 homolog n=1 Tax=Gouania willdenowi TaxID=441366 RepID=UPI001056A62E|nr:ceroid-lipofuscinosis neuronal protein 6 homolog [Gouania willdenowi]
MSCTVLTLLLPAEWCPLKRPGVADYLHFLYNVTSPLILIKMLERSLRRLPCLAVRSGIICVVMGTSLHLLADSIMRRLQLIGCDLHSTVKEDPKTKYINQTSMVEVLELLCYYYTIGQLMWYVPLLLVLVLFFTGCFTSREQQDTMPLTAWVLLLPNAMYYWYLITEGQSLILFIFTFFTMTATVMHQRRRGMFLDSNGLFMMYSFSAALCLVMVWVLCLWNHSVLRKRKPPGLIFLPKPTEVYSLYLQPHI